MQKANKGFRLITISGSSGTGKSLLTKKLASSLGWSIFSIPKRLRQLAQEKGIKVEDINTLPKEIHNQMEDDMADQIKSGKNFILESRLAGWQAKNQTDVLRILVISDQHKKFIRYADREKISIQEAKDQLKNRDQNNLEFYTQLYQAGNYLDPKHYQLIIDSSKMTPEQEVEKVLEYFSDPKNINDLSE